MNFNMRVEEKAVINKIFNGMATSSSLLILCS